MNDFVEDTSNHEVILASLEVLFIQQCQIKHIVDLELNEARRRLNLLEHIEALPVRNIPPVGNQIDQDVDAGEGRH